MTIIDEDYTDLSKAILDSLKFDIAPLRGANSGLIRCVFHSDNTPSCSINLKKCYYHCFQCGREGGLRKLFRDTTGLDPYTTFGFEGMRQDEFQGARSYFEAETDEQRYLDPPVVSLSDSGVRIPVRRSPICLAYLEKRGIPLSMVDEYHMTFAVNYVVRNNFDDDETRNHLTFKNRLLIPVKEQGKLLTIEARDVIGDIYNDPNYKKVLYPPGASTQTLFDYDRLDTSKMLYIVEGLMDLFVLRTDVEFANSTALLGASLSGRQIWMLNQFDNICYIYDNDAAGLRSLAKLRSVIKRSIWALKPPAGCKDVGDIPQKLHTTVTAIRNKKWLNQMKRLHPEDMSFDATSRSGLQTVGKLPSPSIETETPRNPFEW